MKNNSIYPRTSQLLFRRQLAGIERFKLQESIEAKPHWNLHERNAPFFKVYNTSKSIKLACARINPLTIVIVVSDMAKEATSRKLVDLLKKELKCEKCESLGFASGGCISEGKSFDTDNGKIFVKVNTKSEVLVRKQ